MPRKHKLTWQPGSGRRAGRWRKKYKGQTHYFPGGRGKTDREAYKAALANWEKRKLQIDAEARKPHQTEYEKVILEWDLVLTWCRAHGEDEMAEVALEKLSRLRKRLSAPRLTPIHREDRFDGQFDRSVHHRTMDEMIKETAQTMGASMEPSVSKPSHATDVGMVIVPNRDLLLGEQDPLKTEQEMWRDRLAVMQRSATSPDGTVKAHVDRFVAVKMADVAAGELSAGRAVKLRLYLTEFADWVGHDTAVTEIAGQTLSDYRLELLKRMESQAWSRPTAKDRLDAVKSFVRWLWQIEAIASLPRILDGKFQALQIGAAPPRIVIFSKQEIALSLAEACDRTKLYILLMLNCGMTQKDIADLLPTEVDWGVGRITRRRSKTGKFANVPKVSYLLWPETLRLLRQERSDPDSERVLLNEQGEPLWEERIGEDGSCKKTDNIRQAFERLKGKTKIRKPLKSLKKTSASMLRNNEKYASLESLFLGHAPRSMSDRHYTAVPQNLLDAAISWLGDEYGLR